MKKFDGVIEAVHFTDGQVTAVRAFERRGATFSDRIILTRAQLVDRLKNGRKFVTGRRRELWASTFETGPQVQVVSRDGRDLISTQPDAKQDELQGVPLF